MSVLTDTTAVMNLAQRAREPIGPGRLADLWAVSLQASNQGGDSMPTIFAGQVRTEIGIVRLTATMLALVAERDAALDALREVEWVSVGCHAMKCPWCWRLYPEHAPDCQRQNVPGMKGDNVEHDNHA